MPRPITDEPTRKIITDFAKLIAEKSAHHVVPSRTVIYFRDEQRDKKEREIVKVPIKLLRYRKDNGRIASDVLSYERNHGPLDETTEDTQKILRDFLAAKDKEKTGELKKSIIHDSQREAAIITCDGFLINGNRRKMVLQSLYEEFPGIPQYSYMNVVILPGPDDRESGGAPTLLEIEEIENRYQLQSDGKAEYYDFDKALSMQRKIDIGMSLEKQLRDDPRYAFLDPKKFKDALEKVEEEYLKPLECINEYLKHLKRNGMYDTISVGLGDKEGRWQAFVDFYSYVQKKLQDDKKRRSYEIDEDEVGEIKDIAFKIIRKRELSEIGIKLHQAMRLLPKWLSHKDSKKELFKLTTEVDLDLNKKERLDEQGNEHDPRVLDKIWAEKNGEVILRHVKNAHRLYENKEERDTPVDLLEQALRKLNHDGMDTESIQVSEYDRAMKIARDIQKRASEIEGELYDHQKNAKDLLRANRSRDNSKSNG